MSVGGPPGRGMGRDIRWCIRWSVCRSVGRSVGRSVTVRVSWQSRSNAKEESKSSVVEMHDIAGE